MAFFERTIKAELAKTGAPVLTFFVTENHPNTFPALPVRGTANVFVWFSRFPDETACERHAAVLALEPLERNMPGNSRAVLRIEPEILETPADAALAITLVTSVPYRSAAITFNSIAIGVGKAPTSIVVRDGWGLPGPAKYSA